MENKRNILIIVAFLFVMILTASSSWYFFYFTKTPIYSLKIIQESIKNHDLITFQKHVDVESILNHGFDDFVKIFLEETESTNSQEEFGANMLAGFVKIAKQTTVDSLKTMAFDYVETGKVENIEDLENSAEDLIDVKNIQAKIKQNSIQFKKILSKKEENKNATVALQFWVETIKRNIIVELKMNKLHDNTWRVSRIANSKDIFKLIKEQSSTKDKDKKKAIETSSPNIDIEELDVGRNSYRDDVDEIKRTLNNFYDWIAEEEYESAYDCYSVAAKQQQPFDQWVKGYNGTYYNKIVWKKIVDINLNSATIEFKLISRVSIPDKEDGVEEQEYQGKWTLIKEDGVWVLNKANIERIY